MSSIGCVIEMRLCQKSFACATRSRLRVQIIQLEYFQNAASPKSYLRVATHQHDDRFSYFDRGERVCGDGCRLRDEHQERTADTGTASCFRSHGTRLTDHTEW